MELLHMMLEEEEKQVAIEPGKVRIKSLAHVPKDLWPEIKGVMPFFDLKSYSWRHNAKLLLGHLPLQLVDLLVLPFPVYRDGLFLLFTSMGPTPAIFGGDAPVSTAPTTNTPLCPESDGIVNAWNVYIFYHLVLAWFQAHHMAQLDKPWYYRLQHCHQRYVEQEKLIFKGFEEAVVKLPGVWELRLQLRNVDVSRLQLFEFNLTRRFLRLAYKCVVAVLRNLQRLICELCLIRVARADEEGLFTPFEEPPVDALCRDTKEECRQYWKSFVAFSDYSTLPGEPYDWEQCEAHMERFRSGEVYQEHETYEGFDANWEDKFVHPPLAWLVLTFMITDHRDAYPGRKEWLEKRRIHDGDMQQKRKKQQEEAAQEDVEKEEETGHASSPPPPPPQRTVVSTDVLPSQQPPPVLPPMVKVN